MSALSSSQLKPEMQNWNTIFLKSQFTRPPKLPRESIDLTGQVAIVTGGGSGLGYYACLQLLDLKLSRLILAVRSVQKGEDAATRLNQAHPKAKIEVWELEMGSYESIQDFVKRSQRLARLDMVILNAGLTKNKLELNKHTGHEETIQVNYLSTMLLAILFAPVLKSKSPRGVPGRLTIVGSGTAYGAAFKNRYEVPLLPSFDKDPDSYDSAERYWSSKILAHYFMMKFSIYIKAEDVIVNIVDPGLTKGSGLNREDTGLVGFVVSSLKTAVGRTLEVGASTYIDAVVNKGAESHGCFVMDWEIKSFAKMVYDDDAEPIIQRLWDETMEEFEFANARQVVESMRS